MRSVYIETSVWAMAGPNQSPVLQHPTLDFLAQCAGRVHLPYISDIVTKELRRAPADIQEIVLAKLIEVNPLQLPIPPTIDTLAQRFVKEGVLSPRRLDDARHVACAIVNHVDLLVSWNYRHIANARKAEAFNAIAVLCGFSGKIEIHTPLEALEWKKPWTNS